MTKQCVQCSKTFKIFNEDREFYRRIDVPEPTLCPDCRNQRRLLFRQERNLYQRACDKCNRPIVAAYPQNTVYTVYCPECWWSDDWDPLDYGIPYNASKSFFDQFNAVLLATPRVSLVGSHNENSDYVNYANYMKDSYLVVGGHDVEHSLYSWRIYHSKDSVDCTHTTKSELAYYAIDAEEIYNSHFIYKSKGVTDSAFLFDCQAVRNCFLSVNLRTAQYVFKNQQLTQPEYERAIAEYDLASYKNVERGWQAFKELFTNKAIHLAVDAVNSEAVVGNDFVNSHHCYYSFALKESENNRYAFYGEDLKDSMDTVLSGWPGEQMYEVMSAGIGCYDVKFSCVVWTSRNVEYSDNCHDSHDLFGAAGVRKRQYIILNTQYSEGDYLKLRQQIITDMRTRGEYGEFFPEALSPFSYNETLANDFYPLTEEAVKQRQWKWHADLPSTRGQATIAELPDNIHDVTDTIIKEIIACATCGKNYKIIQQELEFHRQVNLALPRLCSNCRLRERMAIRNPLCLWHRQCMCTQPSHTHAGRCTTEFDTAYSPERKEIVYCEQCYQTEIY